MVLKDKEKFGLHIKDKFNISLQDTSPQSIPRNEAGCIPIYHGNPLNNGRILPHPQDSEVHGVRLPGEDLKIPNPKVDMEKAIENMRGLPDYLQQIALFER